MGTTTSNTDYSEVIVVSNYDGSAFSGLLENAFSVSYILNGDSYEDEITSSVSEVGSTGKYVFTTSLPSEGFWLVQIAVSNSLEVVETHYLNIKVKDGSGTTLSAQRSGSAIGAFDTINFTGDGVSVSRNGTVLTVDIVTSQQLPAESSGSSSVPASVEGSSGTLTFTSGTE